MPNAGKSSLLNALTNTNAKVGNYAFTTLEPNLGALYGFILADIPGLIEGASVGKGLGHKFLRHVRRTKRLFHLVSLEEVESGKAQEESKKQEARSKDEERSLGYSIEEGKIVREHGVGDFLGPTLARTEKFSRPQDVRADFAIPRRGSEGSIERLISNYKTVRSELERYGHGLPEKPETIILTKADLVARETVEVAARELSALTKDILHVTVLDDDSVKALKDEIVRRLRADR